LKPLNYRTDLVTGPDEIQTTVSRLVGNDLDHSSPKMTESDLILCDRFCCWSMSSTAGVVWTSFGDIATDSREYDADLRHPIFAYLVARFI
jgi:hypothetical protein